jgi:hypothetical protein
VATMLSEGVGEVRTILDVAAHGGRAVDRARARAVRQAALVGAVVVNTLPRCCTAVHVLCVVSDCVSQGLRGQDAQC